MYAKTLVLAAVTLAVLPVGADANHKKPITKSFSATGVVPWPGGGMCDPAPHGKDRHVETFKAPEAGTFAAELTGFVGDWDMVVTDEKGTIVAESDNAAGTSNVSPSTGSTVEKLKYRVKKAMTLQLHACNFAGGGSATGKYTFTYAK